MTIDPRITFSRASLGTYYDSAGVLKYAAHNLALQSQDFNTTWTKVSSATVTVDSIAAPNGTTTADKLNHVTAGTVAGGGVTQSLEQPTYRAIFSIYAKAGSKNWVSIGTAATTASSYAYFNLASGVVGTKGAGWVSIGIEDAGNGWYRCFGILVTVAGIWVRVGEVDNTINCTTTGDIYLWGAQFEWVTTATTPSTYRPTTSAASGGPRFDYDPVTHAAKGLLIEATGGNSAQHSQNFTNAAWTKTGLTVLADQTTAPDGTTTADTLTASATTATIENGFAGAGNYVSSIFLKKGSSDWVYMVGQITDVPKAWFNLATGVVGTVQAGLLGTSIQDVGNGWYRCVIRDVSATGVETVTVGLCDADNSTTVTVGRTAYVWGAQFESNADFVASYFPIVSSGTRAADLAVMTGTDFSSWYNASAGTFVAEFDLLAATGTRGIMSADNNATTESIRLYGSGADPKVTIIDGGATQADLDVGTIAAATTYKLGVSFAANDIAACLNGGTVGTDTSATMPTPTQLRIGNESGTAANAINGHLRKLKFYNVAKSDAELQALTT